LSPAKRAALQLFIPREAGCASALYPPRSGTTRSSQRKPCLMGSFCGRVDFRQSCAVANLETV
ncbi:MAG TPA: hypothetical protein PKJ77_00135, partial [Thermodesulfobacteriota bacterium]|nr:hypothetical protein [Thermodesulfobacteriota bacterium]